MAPPAPPILVSSDDMPSLQLRRSDTIKTFEDEVREVSTQARMKLGSDEETASHDLDFQCSEVDVLARSVGVIDRHELARYYPRKILLEAQSQESDALRRSLEEDGTHAYERLLERLEGPLGEESRWGPIVKCQALCKLGREHEAKRVLNGISSAHATRPIVTTEVASHKTSRSKTRGEKKASQAAERPHLKASESTLNAQTKDRVYERMVLLGQTEQELDLAIRLQEWDQVKKKEIELYGLSPEIFDLKTHMHRFDKIRQLLRLGRLQERNAETAETAGAKREHLEEALRIYNHGCYATELFHQQFDGPTAAWYDYDHIDCANLFFSAARVCITVHGSGFCDGRGNVVSPRGYRKVEPVLVERTWLEQALYFLEQGRSRALLDSIVRGEEFVPELQKSVLDNAITHAVKAILRIRKRDSMMPESNPSSPPSQAVSPTDSPIDGFQLYRPDSRPKPRDASPAFMQAVDKRTRRYTSDSVNERPVSLSSEPTSPIMTPDRSPRGSFSTEDMKRLKAQMRWRQAKLHAFSEINPTFNAAAAAIPDRRKAAIRKFQELKADIPDDTFVIEYGLASNAPPGLVSLVMSKQSVEAATWRECNVQEIRALIRALRKKMSDDYAVVRRDAQSISPSSPRSALSQPDFEEHTIQDLRNELYNHLISPIENVLSMRQPSRIIIVPSGELAHVPWAMLLSVPFSIVPSLSIWQRLHSQSKDVAMDQPRVAVFSNKPKDNDGYSRDIPFSRFEALYLARLHDSLPQLADDYDRKTFEQHSKSIDILHLCAHSNFDDASPDQASVQLFKEPWSMTQWRELSIKAHIVVFSSCLSAISKAYDSGSTFGFAHTLLASGTRAFIGSLWPVEDEATLLLMMLFYDELRRPSTPVDALYRAQIRLRDLAHQEFFEMLEQLKLIFRTLGVEAKTYVNAPKAWIRILERYDVMKLREPRCWAAFVLTGYGFRSVYPEMT